MVCVIGGKEPINRLIETNMCLLSHHRRLETSLHGVLMELDNHKTLMMMLQGTLGHPHLVAGLDERRGLA